MLSGWIWKFIELLDRALQAFRDDLDQYRDYWQLAVDGHLKTKSADSLADVYSNYQRRLEVAWGPVKDLIISSPSIGSDVLERLSDDLYRSYRAKVRDHSLAHIRALAGVIDSFTIRASDLPRVS